MVNISRIVNCLTNVGIDAFSHAHIKAAHETEAVEKMATQIPKDYSDAVTGYSKAEIQPKKKILRTSKDYFEEYKLTAEKLSKIKEDDIISLEDAIKELEILNLPENKMAELIFGCTFHNKSKDTVVSKAALFMTKFVIVSRDGHVPPKLDRMIHTAIYDDEQVFDAAYFYSLFKPNTWVLKHRVTLEKYSTGRNEIAYYNMDRKSTIYDAIRKHSLKRPSTTQIKVSDIFTPLDSVADRLSSQLDNLIESGVNIPKDLQQSMKKALSGYNFDLKKVFSDYYSLLKDCKTLEDVKTFYPELKYPTKPLWKEAETSFDLSSRLERGGIDKSVIEALTKLYTELTPKNKTFVHIDGSTTTNIYNLERARYNFSSPQEELLEFLKECEKTQNLYKKISKLPKEKLEPQIERHAMRTSGVWRDYEGMTKSGSWLPIRLIKNKRMYPDRTKYSTEKLVDTYLFNLFLRNPYARYSDNPLCRFDGINYLTENGHSVLNRMYMIKFLTKDKNMPANIEFRDFIKYKGVFEEFKKQFDIQAIGKSIEHIEDVYHRHFFRNYWSNARLEALQKQMQKSQDIAYEKVLWGEELRKKEVKMEDIKNMVKAEEGIGEDIPAKLIDEKEFNNFKFILSQINNPSLKERFASAVANGREKSDVDYFNVFNNILKDSFDGGSLDETKAQALLNIHDKYLTEVFEGTKGLSEAQFREEFLARYTTNGKVDYSKILSETNAESTYRTLSSKIINDGSPELLTELEIRFQEDYIRMNEIMEKYLQTPAAFREKFASIYTNSIPSCPNIVLERELTEFLEKIKGWHIDKDEIIELGNFKIPQYIVIPKETKEKLWKLCAGNTENFDEIIKKLYHNGQKRTGEKGGTGIKTYIGSKDYDVELKILGKWGDFRLYAYKATPQDIEKYGQVKYVFYDVTNTH